MVITEYHLQKKQTMKLISFSAHIVDVLDTLVHLNKNGFVYVMNKDNGAIKNVWQFTENMN